VKNLYIKNKFEENLYTVLKDYKKLEPLSVNIKAYHGGRYLMMTEV